MPVFSHFHSLCFRYITFYAAITDLKNCCEENKCEFLNVLGECQSKTFLFFKKAFYTNCAARINFPLSGFQLGVNV